MAQKILVVDDEPDIVRVIELRLKSKGYEVVIARDGEEALKMVKEDSPDLIILDVMMPKLDGYKVCRLLKFDRRFKNTPVLMLTARTQAEDISLATQCGADAYLSKPFQSKEFVDKISELLAAAESSESFQAPS